MGKMIRRILILIILSIRANANEVLIAQYQVTNLNANEQIASIINGIDNYSANKVIITYSGALFYLANDVKVAISENNTVIPIELEGVNPQYYNNNGSITVSLINTSDCQQQSKQDNKSHGDFFDYTTPENGFFKY